jgi:hypothetical protein
MPGLPPPWDEYQRLQTRSSRNSIIDSYSWGQEEEMNLFLENPLAYTSAEVKRLERANAAAARRERARAQMRKVYAADLTLEPPDLDKQVYAREALRLIEGSMNTAQWMLLLDIANGHTQADLAKAQGLEPGNLRVMVSRLRNHAHLQIVA